MHLCRRMNHHLNGILIYLHEVLEAQLFWQLPQVKQLLHRQELVIQGQRQSQLDQMRCI